MSNVSKECINGGVHFSDIISKSLIQLIVNEKDCAEVVLRSLKAFGTLFVNAENIQNTESNLDIIKQVRKVWSAIGTAQSNHVVECVDAVIVILG